MKRREVLELVAVALAMVIAALCLINNGKLHNEYQVERLLVNVFRQSNKALTHRNSQLSLENFKLRHKLEELLNKAE